MASNVQLLIIDPQRTSAICRNSTGRCIHIPASASDPRCPCQVPMKDMERLAALIRQGWSEPGHRDARFPPPRRHRTPHLLAAARRRSVPFTPITAAQCARRVPAARRRLHCRVRSPTSTSWKPAGRYTLMVWPVHCEIGSWGHNVHAERARRLQPLGRAAAARRRKSARARTPGPSTTAPCRRKCPMRRILRRSSIGPLIGSSLIARTLSLWGGHGVKATTEHLVENLPSRRAAKVGRVLASAPCRVSRQTPKRF